MSEIRFHWRAQIAFNVLPEYVRNMIRLELENRSSLSPLGRQSFLVRGFSVSYESFNRSSALYVLEIR